MRMSCWTPDIVRFMEDADRLSPYFGQLAAIASRECPCGGYVLDAGCGMGQLSLSLAGYAGHIDAVDRSPEAIAHLKEAVVREGAANVHPQCADMFAWRGPTAPHAQGRSARLRSPHATVRPNVRTQHVLRPPRHPYDLAVFCLSASFEDAYAASCRMGARRVLVINKIHARNPYEPRPVVDDFAGALARNRRIDPRVRGMRVRLDYGQPLRSLEDAVTYFGLFRTRTYPQGVTTAQVASLLERRDNPEFPYYLPVWRDLAVFVCQTSHRPLPRGLGQDGLFDATGPYSMPRSCSSATACILE